MADEQAQDATSAGSPSTSRKAWSPQAWLGLAVVFAVASMMAAAAAVTNIHEATFDDPQSETMTLYLACIPSIVLGLLSVAALLIGSVRWGVHGTEGRLLSGPEAHAETMRRLQELARRQLLSETAKRVAYRNEDLSALRRVIRRDIDSGAYDAAIALAQEMSSTYGFKEEAEGYREEAIRGRAAGREAKIDQAIEQLDKLIEQNDFEGATQAAAKIQRLFPDSERVRVLDRRVTQAREQYKHDLERRFLQAAQKDDIDAAIQLLEEMDKYLTEQEAEPFRETARGVIGKKRDNLGVQFKMAVQDKEWNQAVRVGEQIIRDFPNSRMADEVRGMLDLLRQRAAGQQAAAKTSE